MKLSQGKAEVVCDASSHSGKNTKAAWTTRITYPNGRQVYTSGAKFLGEMSVTDAEMYAVIAGCADVVSISNVKHIDVYTDHKRTMKMLTGEFQMVTDLEKRFKKYMIENQIKIRPIKTEGKGRPRSQYEAAHTYADKVCRYLDEGSEPMSLWDYMFKIMNY